MVELAERQFGLWESPITPGSLAEERRLERVEWDSDGETVVWLEGRSGRGVLVAQSLASGDAPRDLTGELSVRAEVGYGGGDFTVSGGCVYFAVHKTGRLYRQSLAGGAARPITPAFGSACSPVVSPDGRWLAYVHNDGEDNDRIAVVDLEPDSGPLYERCPPAHWPQILAAGHDFYMQPAWSPDGKRFCWIAWDHPNMPWDGTTLYLADVEVGSGGQNPNGALPRLGEPKAVAGGPETAIFQPEFTADSRRLLFVSDETGWGRIAEYDLENGKRQWLTPGDVEHGLPAWRQGMRTYGVSPDGRTVIAARIDKGFQRLWRIDLESGESRPIELLEDYSDVTDVSPVPRALPVSGARRASGGERFAFIGSAATRPPRVVLCDLDTQHSRVLARGSGETVPASALSGCEAVSWESAGGEQAHGLFYPPASDRFRGQGKPPLIVLIHGGPTSHVRAGWKSDAQFFATRGYAVLYVNYRGSTGYGREYMLKLRGNWGVCDVQDAVSGKEFLAAAGRIDPARTVIMGGSAGGFTVLQTLSERPKSFTAGVCLYGVADQFHLAAQTHKFESRYLDTMLGPLPEASAKYRERSPVFHAEGIVRPLAVYQGAIDRVVPKAQSDAVVEALRKSGTPHIYHVYDEEGHGWRKRDTIEHFYRTVEEFLRMHVIFT